MKISGAVIKDKYIEEHTEKDFSAQYKGKRIEITTCHGHGDAKYSHLARYDIEVRDIKTGMLDVNTYDDFHCMKDAIRYALEGACLLPI